MAGWIAAAGYGRFAQAAALDWNAPCSGNGRPALARGRAQEVAGVLEFMQRAAKNEPLLRSLSFAMGPSNPFLSEYRADPHATRRPSMILGAPAALPQSL